MIDKFKCPDKEIISIKQCLKSCRLKDRCRPVPFLKTFQPKYKRKPNYFWASELNKPLRQLFLMRTIPYAIDPVKSQDMITGIGLHAICESWDIALSEEPARVPIDKFIISCRPDHIIDDGNEIKDGLQGLTIIDNKSTSKGHIDTIRKKGISDDWKWQGNIEYWSYKKAFNLVAKNVVFWAFTKAGEDPDQEKFIIPILPDEEIEAWILKRCNLISQTLEKGTMPEVCADRWYDDSRCWKYCDVNFACPYYQSIQPQDNKPDEIKDFLQLTDQDDPVIIQAIHDYHHAKKVKSEADRQLKEAEAIINPILSEKKLALMTPDNIKARIKYKKQSYFNYTLKEVKYIPVLDIKDSE